MCVQAAPRFAEFTAAAVDGLAYLVGGRCADGRHGPINTRFDGICGAAPPSIVGGALTGGTLARELLHYFPGSAPRRRMPGLTASRGAFGSRTYEEKP
jgi:hypothetical protein